jgi:hypothetical protein
MGEPERNGAWRPITRLAERLPSTARARRDAWLAACGLPVERFIREVEAATFEFSWE